MTINNPDEIPVEETPAKPGRFEMGLIGVIAALIACGVLKFLGML